MRGNLDQSSAKVDKGIDLKRLRYFIAVCDYGGISKAASAIGMAQPALTRQIKLLEAQIGRPLINRSGRGVEPSRPGQYLLDRSREHINSLDNLLSGVRAAFPVTQEPFVLGICPTLASLLLDAIAEHIRTEHPQIGLSIIQATSTDLRSLLRCDRLDMALTYDAVGRDDGVFTELVAEPFQLVRMSGPSKSIRRWSLSDVAGLNLVLPSRLNEARQVIDSICHQHRISLNPRVELDSIDAVVLMLSQEGSNYASILPRLSIDKPERERGLRRDELDGPKIQRMIGILAPKTSRNLEAFELVSTQVRDAVAKLDL